MRTHRFGQRIKLPSTRAIKHQILKLTLEDHLRESALDATLTEGIDAEERPLQESAPKTARSV